LPLAGDPGTGVEVTGERHDQPEGLEIHAAALCREGPLRLDDVGDSQRRLMIVEGLALPADVRRRLREAQGYARRTADLADQFRAEAWARSGPEHRRAIEVGKRKVGRPIATVERAEQREYRRVLGDRQKLSIGERRHRVEVAGEGADHAEIEPAAATAVRREDASQREVFRQGKRGLPIGDRTLRHDN